VIGDVIADRYQLEELSGTGGMSRVFRARDLQLGRRVALKILHERFAADPVAVERFRREARAAARLSHPNIVTVIDRGESEGRQFIVFEYVEGESLKQLVARAGPLPVAEALELTVQVGRALAFAHAHGVVHRDVKPQNVLLRDGTPKVTDFGIARTVDVDGAGHTATGTVLGTADYLSPEQARGENATERSDVYSLAVCLFELLTGRVPFSGENAVAVALRHVDEPPPGVRELRPEVPPRLAAAVARGMAKDPEARFESMDAFIAELELCADELRWLGAEATVFSGAMVASGATEALEATVAEATVAAGPEQAFPEAAAASPRPAVLPDHPALARRPRRRRLVALAAAALVAAVAAIWLVRGQAGSPGPPTNPAAAAGSVRLRAVAAYDPPPGGGHEHDELLAAATDGSPATSWETEHYFSRAFGGLKSGVGIVLDAGRPVRLGSLTVDSDTPGFTASVQAGSSPSGPFRPISARQTVESRTTFTLHVPRPSRYYLLWISELPPGQGRFQAHVNEVVAS